MLIQEMLLHCKNAKFHNFFFTDPKKDTKIKLDGKEIVVPQGVPLSQAAYANKSSFSQSEYLVYKESQNMMRYLVMVDL